jgi:pimeloyl-ACP methyl ester carboxylesterase
MMMRRRTLVALAAGTALAAPARGFAQAEANPATPMSDTTPPTGYAPVNGLELYYEVHGSGEPLVLLHGAFGAIDLWGPILATLAETNQVIAVEFQGHGHTADIDRPFSTEQWADDVAALLAHLAIEQADVVGYSMGGMTGLQLAIRHPRLVRKLVPVSANSRSDGYYPELLAGLAMMTPDIFAGTPQEAAYLRHAPNPGDFPALVEKHKAFDAAGFAWPEEDVAAIAAPTLLMYAERIVAPRARGELFRLLGGGVPRADHEPRPAVTVPARQSSGMNSAAPPTELDRGRVAPTRLLGARSALPRRAECNRRRRYPLRSPTCVTARDDGSAHCSCVLRRDRHALPHALREECRPCCHRECSPPDWRGSARRAALARPRALGPAARPGRCRSEQSVESAHRRGQLRHQAGVGPRGRPAGGPPARSGAADRDGHRPLGDGHRRRARVPGRGRADHRRAARHGRGYRLRRQLLRSDGRGNPTAESMVSADRRSTIIPATLAGELDDLSPHAQEYLDAVRAQAGNGYEVLTVGGLSADEEFGRIAEEDLAKGEGIGVGVALIVLVVLFAALVAAGVPIILAMVSIFVAMGLTRWSGSSSSSPTSSPTSSR